MHNALRDDGKYGYITRQRPMLFSLASHWLMLIRKSNVVPTNMWDKDKRRSLRRTLCFLSLSLSLSFSLCLYYSCRSSPWKRAFPEIPWNRVTTPCEENSPIIRGRRIPSEYAVLVISYDTVFNLRRVPMVVTCDETMTEKENVLLSRERKLRGARFLRKTSLVFYGVYFFDDSKDDWKIGNSSIDVHITVIP